MLSNLFLKHNSDCTACKNFANRGRCEERCPDNTFPLVEQRTCINCLPHRPCSLRYVFFLWI